MVAATPETLGTVVSQILAAASQLADDGTQDFTDVMDAARQQAGQLVDEATQLPEELLARLKNFAKDPDWNSLLVFVFLKIAELDDKFSVGTMQAPGFAPAVALVYSDPAMAGTKLVLGVSLGRAAIPGRHGLHLRCSGTPTLALGDDTGITLNIKSSGNASWDWEFGKAPEAPADSAQVNAAIAWHLPVPSSDPDRETFGFSVGPAMLSAVVGHGPQPADISYEATISLGDPTVDGRHGVHASINLGRVLGDFSQLVNLSLPEIDYSPHLTLKKGAAPQFSLT
ncbi:hypothetical protein JOF48_003529 [Arthrobacter stackebrandtii]|uniref:Uncharacterized protein n=1 Tax=Arthrobacter stackebrandtii TaxID=272161 RepID=A0ABS4Z135_9MICC|nr:hypothetical protein [Arthrobacter stackebrandtii]MBP2414730.1 hypothetical protein [Arthrobacter stackebrandtii]PYH01814.1 hypothetical protein CVV67_05020 [Arthrobacter stackebrandtii]